MKKKEVLLHIIDIQLTRELSKIKLDPIVGTSSEKVILNEQVNLKLVFATDDFK